MEQFQEAWIRAVAAASGCTVFSVGPVDEGIDALLMHRHEGHITYPEKRVSLHLQLKATSLAPLDGYARAKMSRQRFREYAVKDPTVNQIVVILAMHKTQAHWLYATNRSLNLYGSSHWVNLAGEDVPTGADEATKVTLRAPLSQVFDDVGLAQIMERMGKGGRP